MRTFPLLPLTPPKRVSLVAQTIQSLRAALASGYWRGTLPGERMLCQTLEVSRPTLRAALAELQREGGLKAAGRRRRRIVAKVIGLQPSNRTVGVISPAPLQFLSLTNVLMIDALREHLSKGGWTVEMHVSRSCFTQYPGRALEELTSRTPAGTWLLITSLRPMQEWFVRRSLRCLVAGTCMKDITLPSVDADHYAAARHAGTLLLRRGHRRIALVRTDEDTGGDNESERGLHDVVAANPTATLRVLRHRSRDHLVTLIDQMLRTDAHPTAYFVLRSAHALTVTMHLLRRRQRVPEDAAVISRDDEDYLAHTSPLISRYAVNADRFARQISRLIRTMAETRTLNPRAVRLMPSFITGETL